MGTSFQDQLLKSGLVNKKQAKKSSHEKQADRKKNKGKAAPPEINEALEEKLAKEKLSRELNQQLNQEKQKLANLSEARHLIETNRLKLEDDWDEPYHFAEGKKIKKLFVTEQIAKKLSIGQLAIVKLDDHFEVVPAKVARQIVQRDTVAFVVLHEPESS